MDNDESLFQSDNEQARIRLWDLVKNIRFAMFTAHAYAKLVNSLTTRS